MSETHRFYAVKLPCSTADIIRAGTYLEGWWREHHGDTPHKVEADFTGGVRISNELIFKVSGALKTPSPPTP